MFLNLDEIDWVEAAANYVRLNAGKESYLFRETISRISERLNPNHFIRIHRSMIVNVRKIKELIPVNSGEYIVVLKSGKELSCSRGYRANVQHMIRRELSKRTTRAAAPDTVPGTDFPHRKKGTGLATDPFTFSRG